MLQTFDNQLLKSKFGLIVAFFYGSVSAIHSAIYSTSRPLTDAIRNMDWASAGETCINTLLTGGIAFVGGNIAKYLWGLLLKKFE